MAEGRDEGKGHQCGAKVQLVGPATLWIKCTSKRHQKKSGIMILKGDNVTILLLGCDVP